MEYIKLIIFSVFLFSGYLLSPSIHSFPVREILSVIVVLVTGSGVFCFFAYLIKRKFVDLIQTVGFLAIAFSTIYIDSIPKSLFMETIATEGQLLSQNCCKNSCKAPPVDWEPKYGGESFLKSVTIWNRSFRMTYKGSEDGASFKLTTILIPNKIEYFGNCEKFEEKDRGMILSSVSQVIAHNFDVVL